ncbi:Rna polymerase II [Blastocladiella britannica]|nr:Rna polymerase II [Blastocladiella britannica]
MSAVTMSFSKSTCPIRTVNGVQFGILSPDEIKNMSVAHIIYPESVEEGKDRPKSGGVNDPRLGTIDRHFKCETCHGGMSDCPGHFGHIELARPVYHISFLARVKKILECVCYFCAKLKADPNTPDFKKAVRIRDRNFRFLEVHKLCKVASKCPCDPEPGTGGAEDELLAAPDRIALSGCGKRQPAVRKKGMTLSVEWRNAKGDDENTGREDLTPEGVQEILKRISDEDCRSMGLDPDYARPEWMILTVFPVPPPAVRPSILNDGTSLRNEDDLTYKLADIIRANAHLRKLEEEGSRGHMMKEHEDLLQFHCATFVDNEISGMQRAMHKSGRPMKALRSRLKGKEGRLRGNLMGKRVDFSARTVITGDPNLSIDQVGVPRSIASNLSYPERVTRYNINRLQEFVTRGAEDHPGAKYVIRPDGSRVSLAIAGKVTVPALQPGWIVERHLMDDDVIIFNRQPSLHKMSMMGHRVKVMPFSTFRLNLSVTSPYNADFDGDEMNLHVPQSVEARAEIAQLCMVPLQIVSPQSNKPVMGIVQDTLCGITKFSRRDTFMDRSMVMNLLMWVPGWDGTVPVPAIIKPKPLWTGKQILSLIIPKVNCVTFHSGHPEDESTDLSPGDTRVVVEAGELLAGIICKKTVGTAAGGLIHVSWVEHGPEAAKALLNGCQTIVNYWLLHNGFSIGIGDTIANPTTMNAINKLIENANQSVSELIEKARVEELERQPGMTIRETFEASANKFLNEAVNEAGKAAAASFMAHNNVKHMVTAGSKGSNINISQMSACVGQQNVEGKRIPFGFQYRSLPHFTKDDYSPESRGFVENSYLRGLHPHEFFFHAMGGREGLIDTACKTAETGYIQRRLVKALEDIMVKYDGTVRNAQGNIVQFAYGEDGMDGTRVESQVLISLTMDDDRFQRRFRLDVMSSDGPYRLAPGTVEYGIEREMQSHETQALLDEEFQRLSADRRELQLIFPHGDARWPLPGNLARVIWNAQNMFKIDRQRPSNLHPEHVIGSVRELCKSLIVVPGDDKISIEAQRNATLLMQILIRSTLATKRVLEEFRLDQRAFDYIVGEIRTRFVRAQVHPGEMVGIIAAQSIGEPATQMTLNTFHFAGVSSKNVTLGVPRLKEIINVATNIKTPSLTIYLDETHRQTIAAAKAIQSQIEHANLRKATLYTQILYEPKPEETEIPGDQEFIDNHYAVEGTPEQFSLSPWVLRIQLDGYGVLVDKDMQARDVAALIHAKMLRDGQPSEIIYSEGHEYAVVRIRVFRGSDTDELDAEGYLRALETKLLDEVTLKGIPKIERVYMSHQKLKRLDANGRVNSDYKEWILETDGTNMREVMVHPNVRANLLYSNDCIEILDVLGIEAARAAVLKEIRNVIERDGSYVNYRHLAMLVDVMTSRGKLMSITRHGINRTEASALMRCSFEETVEILVDAAGTGLLDDCTGVAENIILGQVAPLGSGSFEVLLDEDLLKRQLPGMGDDGLVGGMTPYGAGAMTPHAHTPDYLKSAGGLTAIAGLGAAFSPGYDGGMGGPGSGSGSWTPGGGGVPSGAFSPGHHLTGAGGASPGYGAVSPGYSVSTSPGYSAGYSPTSPMGYSTMASPAYAVAQSPGYALGAASPGYGAGSSLLAGSYSPTSPLAYSPTSPGHFMSPASPGGLGAARYSPTSPAHNYGGMAGGPSPVSPNSYSPTAATWSPASPAFGYSPASPGFPAQSPSFSPTSPAYPMGNGMGQFSSGGGAGGHSFSPTSPSFSPASPSFSPASPSFSPASPSFSPTSPALSPTSPSFSPSSPSYSPGGN